MDSTPETRDHLRERLLAGTPLHERRLHLADIPTAVLEGGDGPPVVLLHGPGEFAATWLPVFADLVRAHRVIAPDLPGHGASGTANGRLDADSVLGWLGALIEATCPTAPVLVGRVVGGAIAARYAADHPGRLAHLVLVDTLGLTSFAPAPRFGLALHRFFAEPIAATYDRLMDLCAFDLDHARRRLGQRWEPYAAYAVELAGTPGGQAAMGALIEQFGAAAIPPSDLDRIQTPTTVIWGRHDLATPLTVAEAAAARHGWPLHVIEGAGDDPPLDQPEAFLAALHVAIGTPVAGGARS